MSASRFERLVTWVASWSYVPPVLVDERDADIRHHAIVIGSAGYPLKIRLGGQNTDLWDLLEHRRMEDPEFQEYLNEMIDHLRGRYDNGTCRNGVMVIIHGGNEAPHSTINLTLKLYERIERAGYYPVFINWDASLWRSYVQQLLHVRSGVYNPRPAAWALFYVVPDVLRSIMLLPSAFWLYVRLLWHSREEYQFPTSLNLGKFTTPKLKEAGWWPGGLTVSITRFLVSTIVQVAALLVTGAGVPRAWENLLRRTRAMFRAPREFEWGSAPDGTSYQDCEGAMAVFLRRLATTVTSCPGMKVTFLAHSMGSMIANDALQYWRELPVIIDETLHGRGMHIDSIVYMAPACSTRSFAAAVGPILAKQTDARAYVLTLHPRLEAAQRDWHGMITGSALEWIEGVLATPHSYLDRMLGKWDNALRTLHIYPDGVRDRLHFKSFSYNEPKKPSSHSAFYHPDLDPPFWSQRFWW